PLRVGAGCRERARPGTPEPEPDNPARRRMIHALTERLRRTLETVQDFSLFTAALLKTAFVPPFYGREMMHQLYFAGIGSRLIVVVSGTVAGQALGLQLARELAQTGAKSQLGHFMVISVVRALGPVAVGMGG